MITKICLFLNLKIIIHTEVELIFHDFLRTSWSFGYFGGQRLMKIHWKTSKVCKVFSLILWLRVCFLEVFILYIMTLSRSFSNKYVLFDRRSISCFLYSEWYAVFKQHSGLFPPRNQCYVEHSEKNKQFPSPL